jgi:hypothetical protein
MVKRGPGEDGVVGSGAKNRVTLTEVTAGAAVTGAVTAVKVKRFVRF